MEKDLHIVGFRVGRETFGVPISLVHEIVRVPEITAVPDAPDCIEGVINLRGKIVSVVDLRKRFGLEAGVREETRLMVLDLEHQRVGVLVDEVREVMRVDSTTITAPGPLVSGLAAAYIAGIVTRPGRTIIILNARKLLSSTERLALSGIGSS